VLTFAKQGSFPSEPGIAVGKSVFRAGQYVWRITLDHVVPRGWIVLGSLLLSIVVVR